MNITAAELVAQARGQIIEVSADQFAAEAAELLIDVREPAEFADCRIDGAINIPRGVLEFELLAHPAMAHAEQVGTCLERPLTVYCRSGGRAALAAQVLQRMGFRRVRSIAGGIAAWSAAGLPLCREQPST